MVAFSFIVLLWSCHKDSEPSIIESITLSSDFEEVYVGQQVHFSVVANTKENITSQAIIYRDTIKMQGSIFSSSKVGTYKFYAKYKDIVSNTVKITVNEKPIESIKIQANESEITLGKPFPISILTNTGKDITSEAKLFVNGELYAHKAFYPEEVGEYTLYAAYKYKEETFKTDKVTIKVLPVNTKSFVKHPVIEGYTHSRCPWCPRLYYAIKKLEEVTDKSIFISNHPITRSNWKDFLHTEECIPLWEDFKSKYEQYNSDNYKAYTLPNADIDRAKYWSKPQPEKLEEVTNLLDKQSLIGLSLDINKNEDKLEISVRTQFLQDFNKGLKLTVYVLEDNIVHDYPNLTEYFDGVNPVKDFVSNHVFRHTLTDIFGDDIPKGKTKKNKLYIKDFSVEIPSNISKSENISVVAFVTSKDKKHIINARVIALGDKKQSFEEK